MIILDHDRSDVKDSDPEYKIETPLIHALLTPRLNTNPVSWSWALSPPFFTEQE